MKEKTKENIKQEVKKNKNKAIVYILLRLAVVGVMIAQIANHNWNNVFLCVLTLILFMIPSIVDKRFHIEMPTTLEVIILIFIFAAEILGEIQAYYIAFPYWDEMLHTTNGFLMAAIGFSLIDILNQNENFSMSMSPIFVTFFAFCFSMTVGVLWEFFEFSADWFLGTDMQKDTFVQVINSVLLNASGANVAINVPIQSVVVNGQNWPGYIDIGLIDTMSDLFVNFIGAVVFSLFGFFYIKGRGKGRFVRRFMPRMKGEVPIPKALIEKEEEKEE